MDCSPPGSSFHGIHQARIPGIKARFPALHADSLPSEPPGKPLVVHNQYFVFLALMPLLFFLKFFLLICVIPHGNCICLSKFILLFWLIGQYFFFNDYIHTSFFYKSIHEWCCRIYMSWHFIEILSITWTSTKKQSTNRTAST